MENDNTGTGSKPEEKKSLEQPTARREGPSYTQGNIPYPPGTGPVPPPMMTIYQPYYVNECCAKPKRSSKPGVAGGLLITTGLIAIIVGFAAMVFSFSLIGTGSFPPGSNGDGTGEISGEVIFQNMTAAENVTITVTDTGQLATTNATGHFRILGVKTGTQQLKVEYPNYKTILQKVRVGRSMMNSEQSSSVTRVDFQLTPGEGTITIDSGTSDEEWGMGFAKSMLSFCSVLWILLGVLQIAGGYFALQRQKFAVAVAGGVAGLLSPLSILSIIALIVLFLSSDEFKKGQDTEGTKLPEARPLESPGQRRG